MKRKVIAMLLATCMITSTAVGCGAKGGNQTTDAGVETSDAGAVTSISDAEVADSSAEASSSDAQVKGSGTTLGGKPWIESNIKENITEGMTATPKDDFYLFCNYDKIRNTEIPEGDYGNGTVYEIEKIVSEKKLNVIKDETGTTHDQKLVNGLYKQITDWDFRNEGGFEPAKKTIEEISNIKDMDELNAYITDYDENIFVNRIIVNEIDKDFDSDKKILWVNYFDYLLGGAEEYSERTEIGDRAYNAYKTLNETVLGKMGYSKEAADKLFDDAISFEAKIAEVDYTTEESMQSDFLLKMNNHYSKEELYKLFDNYPIEDCLKNNGYDKAKDILVPNPKVSKRIDEVYTADNLEEIKAFMIVHYVDVASDYFDKESYDAAVKAGNELKGITGALPDDKVAVNTISKRLSELLQRAYLQKYDATKTKQEITELCKEIIATYEEMLKGEEWLSDETKKMAIDKLENIKINAAYPDEWNSDHKDLELSDSSLIESLENIEKHKARIKASELDTKSDSNKWDADCLVTDMFYYTLENTMYVPLGFLDGDAYYDGISKEELYGAVGCIIGHEISHAFDPNGAQFDKNGQAADWWTEADYEAFGQRVAKVDAYYDAITVWEGQNVKGSNIDTEAIADMGGMKVALKMAESIKDFDYKKFFEAYSNIFFAISTPEAEQIKVANNPHPLLYLRPNVTVQQFDEFYETYDVKEGDNMYLAPEDRILVW